jgi:F0F1-type ATP synthase membrane subunit b/b'
MFLGRLGIDFNLILAQVVNFAILVFILFKFVYKPIYKKIEEDEAKLKEAQTKSQVLDEQKIAFDKKSHIELEQIREKSEATLSQAQAIAKNIREESLKKAQAQADEILKLAKQESSYVPKSAQNLSKIFDNKKIYSDLEDIFFKNLMDKLRHDLVKYKNLGHISLEYAHPLSAARLKELNSFIGRYVKAGQKVIAKENKSLIAGFRLTSDKLAIDENLAFEIKNE